MCADDLETAEKRLKGGSFGQLQEISFRYGSCPVPPLACLPALDLTQFLWGSVKRQLGKVDTDFK